MICSTPAHGASTRRTGIAPGLIFLSFSRPYFSRRSAFSRSPARSASEGCCSIFFATDGRASYLLAVSFGTASLLAALMLTWFNPRYTLALLPVGLLMVVHLEQGAQRLEAAFRDMGGARARRALALLGAVLLLGGLVMNEGTCSILLRKIVSPSARFNIRSLDVMVVLGALISWAAAARIGRSALPAASAPTAPRYADAIVFASALLVPRRGGISPWPDGAGQSRTDSPSIPIAHRPRSRYSRRLSRAPARRDSKDTHSLARRYLAQGVRRCGLG